MYKGYDKNPKIQNILKFLEILMNNLLEYKCSESGDEMLGKSETKCSVF